MAGMHRLPKVAFARAQILERLSWPAGHTHSYPQMKISRAGRGAGRKQFSICACDQQHSREKEKDEQFYKHNFARRSHLLAQEFPHV